LDIESKNRLENLKKKNKVRHAKEQLISVLKSRYDADISDKLFVDYELSNKLHIETYKKIRTDEIKSKRFYYEIDKLKEMVEWIFNINKNREKENVLFYPVTFGYFFRSSNQLYLDFPLAILLPFVECRDIVLKIMTEIHDDLVIISEDLGYGFVLSEDEYSYVTIEYWGMNKE
jgi:hypothetical protein